MRLIGFAKIFEMVYFIGRVTRTVGATPLQSAVSSVRGWGGGGVEVSNLDMGRSRQRRSRFHMGGAFRARRGKGAAPGEGRGGGISRNIASSLLSPGAVPVVMISYLFS